MKELTDSIEGNAARHREEVVALQQQHDALLASLNREKEEALTRQQEMEVQLRSSQSNESQTADSQASEHVRSVKAMYSSLVNIRYFRMYSSVENN